MKAGYIVGTVLETIIKVVVIAGVVLFAFKGASQAYDFGYRVFADQPVSVAGGRTITVGISENMTVKDIAQMLEEKGLIEDARLLVVQELLSAYHKEIKPGIYDLSTDMTAAQMLEIMSTPAQQDTQEENTASEAEVEQSAEEDALSENILENPEMQGE